jgi:hypothetical protein
LIVQENLNYCRDSDARGSKKELDWAEERPGIEIEPIPSSVGSELTSVGATRGYVILQASIILRLKPLTQALRYRTRYLE